MKITAKTLLAVASHGNVVLCEVLAPAMNYWFVKYGMMNKEVLRHVISQWAEETDSYKVLKEYASGAAYEGRRSLGNTQPGDGPKFKGRGPDMITGRANATKIGNEINVDLINHPELMSDNADIGVMASCQFWKDNGLIALALQGQSAFHEITVKINGGTNGIGIRWAFYQSACSAITEDLDAAVDPAYKPAIFLHPEWQIRHVQTPQGLPSTSVQNVTPTTNVAVVQSRPAPTPVVPPVKPNFLSLVIQILSVLFKRKGTP